MTITHSRIGRLGRVGNQLFQVAGALAVATARREDLRLGPWAYARWFSAPPAVFAGATGDEAHEFAPHLGDAAPYLQDWELVASVEETVRRWFAPSPRSIAIAPTRRAAHTTALHVRRTDYLALADHYRTLDADWYQRAVALVRAVQPDTSVEVYSDDAHWCRHALPGDWKVMSAPADLARARRRDRDGHPLARRDEMTDFWGLATADAVIAANSSFSWWAAWLSRDPHPIVPARWYGPANAHLDERRLQPPHWRAL